MDVLFDRGPYLPDLDLPLDSRVRRTVGYISHAHSDHVARHGRSILSQATLHLLESRFKSSDACVLQYGEPYETASYTLTLYPAGHCLGSAQVLVQSRATGERILYTGDFKVRPDPTAEPSVPVLCDTLIMEATYGRPHYIFPPTNEVLARCFATLRTWLSKGESPVIMAYRLGKAQELLHYLTSQGFDVAVEENTYRVAGLYEELGVRFPGRYRLFDGQLRDGELLLCPPGKRRSPQVQGLRGKRWMALSGWAADSGAQRRLGVDEALPFSDHADFSELVRYVQQVRPQRVYTVNGFSELAAHLRDKGYQAEHLTTTTAAKQLRML